MQETLTSREQEIFNLLLDGISPKEIAHKLHVSSKAVDYHRGNLYGKLDTTPADGYTLLNPYIDGILLVKKNIEYTDVFYIYVNKNASSTEPNANQIVLDVWGYNPDQPPPTLTFTKLEVTKEN